MLFCTKQSFHHDHKLILAATPLVTLSQVPYSKLCLYWSFIYLLGMSVLPVSILQSVLIVVGYGSQTPLALNATCN